MDVVDIESAGVSLPGQPISTEMMLEGLAGRISTELRTSVKNMGIESRYSVLTDYPGYVCGHTERTFATSATNLAAASIEHCLNNWDGDSDDIGLLIAVTNSADRPLPCLGYELIACFRGRLPDDANILNLQNMGCSSLIKAIGIAKEFVANNTGKKALVVVVEAVTGLTEKLMAPRYQSFREIAASQCRNAVSKMYDIQRFLFAMLFGDAAVAFVLGRTTNTGRLGFGTIVHATNLKSSDAEILRMNDGGVHIPANGIPFYEMNADVPMRGAVYISEIIARLLRKYCSDERGEKIALPNFDFYHVHTGSKKILNSVFQRLDVDATSGQARESIDTLTRYANTSACSVGLMLAQRCQHPSKIGFGLVVSFGVGFSASAAIVSTGWNS